VTFKRSSQENISIPELGLYFSRVAAATTVRREIRATQTKHAWNPNPSAKYPRMTVEKDPKVKASVK